MEQETRMEQNELRSELDLIKQEVLLLGSRKALLESKLKLFCGSCKDKASCWSQFFLYSDFNPDNTCIHRRLF